MSDLVLDFAELLAVAAEIRCCEQRAEVSYTASGELDGREQSVVIRRCDACGAELTVSRKAAQW